MTKPFLKWAGGKTQIVSKLLSFLPRDVKNRVYHEPFLGAGSMFFAIKPSQSFLSDANEHLIKCYGAIGENPRLVCDYLNEHKRKNCERYYYQIRDLYNKADFSIAQAARFIYLNKACYNGVFRVNKLGEFNVPYGKKSELSLPCHDHLLEVSQLLANCTLSNCNYEESLIRIKKGHFVYLDPPYPPINGTSYFTHYTPDKFGPMDQERVATFAKAVAAKGAFFMVSNADTPVIRKLYEGFDIVELSVTRFITCKKIRHKVGELVITNFAGEQNAGKYLFS